MKAFKNEKQKEELLKQLKHHQELDAFIQGAWLSDEKAEDNAFKGCFYGCTMQTREKPREAFSEKYNIDLWYVYLTEKIFEGLPKGEFKTFPVDSIDIIPVGFDFNKIKSPFFYALLMDEEKGQINFCETDEQRELVKQCADLFTVDFDKIDKNAADDAVDAVDAVNFLDAPWSVDAAKSAARCFVLSAVYAVDVAASSAASSATSYATWSVNYAAWSAANKSHYVWMRDLLFSLIKKHS